MINDLMNYHKLRLAPMAGVTNAPFRSICLSNNSGYVTTEEIDATSLVYNKSNRTKEIISFYKKEKPLAMQLLGCDEEIMSEAAIILQDLGADIIDINMGCPVPKIIKKGKGAALMKDISNTSHLVNKIRSVTKIPLTVKIRSGWDKENENAVEFSQMLEQEGVDAITIHPRTRDQRYEGLAKWETIKQVVNSVKIPITGNGDVKSFEDAKSMMSYTSCNSVMIGRAAIGNPWIFSVNFQNLSEDQKILKITQDIYKHIDLINNFFLPNNIDLQIKKHLAYYSKGFNNSKELRQKIFRTEKGIDFIIDLFINNLYKNFDLKKKKIEKISI